MLNRAKDTHQLKNKVLFAFDILSKIVQIRSVFEFVLALNTMSWHKHIGTIF